MFDLGNTMKMIRIPSGVFGVSVLLTAMGTAGLASTPTAFAVEAPHDGQHDLDFNIGSWNAHIRVLRSAPSDPPTWIELRGTAVVRRVWNGRAQLEEVEADGSTGHFEALVLLLYDPVAHQWSKTFANSNDGQLGSRMTGEFHDGRGEFFNQENYHGRTALMRAVWSDISAGSQHFEESFSYDGGRSWRPYFVATFTRAGQ